VPSTLIDAREFGQLAQDLRRAPKVIRDAVKRDSRTEIAEPLAGKIRAAASGPWAKVLAPGTKTRAGSGAEAQIVVGGVRPKLSGGGGPRSVVYGTEFGGGKRLTAVPTRGRRRGYRRFSTNQFRRNKRPFIFPTVAKNIDAIVEAYAGIVSRALDDVLGGA
jgi:hypothetical protein